MLSANEPVELNLHSFSGLTEEAYRSFVAQGERFVVYQYAISVVVYSMQHPTKVYRVKGRMDALLRGLPFTALTALLGWWGFPHGPIFTINSLVTNLRGGRDVGPEVLEFIRQQDPRYQYGPR